MTVRIEPAVHWREGLFLCPQHLQAFARELHSRIFRGDSASEQDGFGLQSLAIDEEALHRNLFSIRSASLVLPDGTFLTLPGNATVDARGFEEHFRGAHLDVHLGVRVPAAPCPPPVLTGAANDADATNGNGRGAARFATYELEVFDENRLDSERRIEFRQLTPRLFFGAEERAGFESLRIARITRVGRPEAVTALDPTDVPSVLRRGASRVLTERLASLVESLRAEARDLARRVPALASLTSVDRATDIAALIKLQAVNQGLVALEQLDGSPDTHPRALFRALVDLVGGLAILAEERVPPALPSYDHGDLAGSFVPVFELLDDLVTRGVVVPYDAAELEEDPLVPGRFACAVPDSWTASQHRRFFLAVEVAEAAETLEDKVEALVRLTSPSREQRTLRGATPDVALRFEAHPPTSFPRREDLHFFRIETGGTSRDGWESVLAERQALLFAPLGTLGALEAERAARFSIYVELA